MDELELAKSKARWTEGRDQEQAIMNASAILLAAMIQTRGDFYDLTEKFDTVSTQGRNLVAIASELAFELWNFTQSCWDGLPDEYEDDALDVRVHRKPGRSEQDGTVGPESDDGTAHRG